MRTHSEPVRTHSEPVQSKVHRMLFILGVSHLPQRKVRLWSENDSEPMRTHSEPVRTHSEPVQSKDHRMRFILGLSHLQPSRKCARTPKLYKLIFRSCGQAWRQYYLYRERHHCFGKLEPLSLFS